MRTGLFLFKYPALLSCPIPFGIIPLHKSDPIVFARGNTHVWCEAHIIDAELAHPAIAPPGNGQIECAVAEIEILVRSVIHDTMRIGPEKRYFFALFTLVNKELRCAAAALVHQEGNMLRVGIWIYVVGTLQILAIGYKLARVFFHCLQ